MKTKTIFIGDNIDFVEIMKEFDTIEDDSTNVVIIVQSGGGTVYHFSAIKRRILELSRTNTVRVHLYAAGSCAFNICYDLKNLVELCDDADGWVHCTAYSGDYSGTVLRSEDPVEIGRHKIMKPMPHDFLTDEEKELFNNGRLIYLPPDRMQEIFKQ